MSFFCPILGNASEKGMTILGFSHKGIQTIACTFLLLFAPIVQGLLQGKSGQTVQCCAGEQTYYANLLRRIGAQI